jgi:hypothetical protein
MAMSPRPGDEPENGGADEPQSTDDLIRQVLAEQQQNRAEVAELRKQLDAAKQPVQAAPSTVPTAEEALAARMQEISEHDFICPDCGLLYDYQQKCTGKVESPHPASEVVSTDTVKSEAA